VRIVADEKEFWNRAFDDADAPGTAPADGTEPAGRARTVPRDAFAVRRRGIVERLLDRARDWRSDGRFGVVMLIVVAVAAGAIWYRIGIGGGSAAGATSSSASPVTRTTPPATTTTRTQAGGSPTRIAVHVAGAVAHPGVVELGPGTRVVDAVEAVGGAHADADLDRLNLAAKLADGQRIYVPKVGEADPGALGRGEAAGTGTGSGTGDGAPLGGKLNLNTATQAQLETLPGIGPTYAQSILAERQRRGGFTSVNELRSVRGIGDKRFAELAPLVTV
jgi:competence protein ComEA